MQKLCKVEGCSTQACKKGYCDRHYQQIRAHGKIFLGRSDPNRVFIKRDHAEIELRDKNSNIVGYALVDNEDIKACQKYKWCASGSYVVARINNKTTLIHRFILNNDSPHTDHINGNGFDNRRCNIRECTAQQNSFNFKRTKNASGTTGVYFDKRRGKWYGQIFLKQGTLSSGYLLTKKEAVSWRMQMEEQYHKDFRYPKGNYEKCIVTPTTNKKKVVQYSLKRKKFIAEYESQQEAARQTGVTQNGISKCCRNGRESAGGFIWEFK